MENTQTSPKKVRIIVGAALLLTLAFGGWWYTRQPATYSYPLAVGDSISSWNFQGSHKDGGALEKKVNEDIAYLKTQLHNKEGEPTDYSIYISISSAYTLLGDGAKAYEYLLLALAIDSEKTGLAWHNLAALMERLGALGTARDAYTRAVTAQPHIEQYQIARLDFMQKNFSEDTAVLDADFADAETRFQDPSILQIKAAWLTKVGRFQDAIDAWKAVQKALPQHDPAVDGEIAKLRARL